MARRGTWRIPIRMKVMLEAGGREYPGTVTNISENGMYITTDQCPGDDTAQFRIAIPVNDSMLHVPGTLVRRAMMNGGCLGMGVTLQNPPQSYIDFVENLLYVL